MMESQFESAEAHQSEMLEEQHESHEIVKEIKQEVDLVNQYNEEAESSNNWIKEPEFSDLKTDPESSQQCASLEPEVTHKEKRQGNWEGLVKLPPGIPVFNTLFNPVWPLNISTAMRFIVSLLGNVQRQQRPQIPSNIAQNCGPFMKTPFCPGGPGIFSGGLRLPQFTPQLLNLSRPRFEPFRPVMGPCGFGMGPPGSFGPRMGPNVGPTGSGNGHMGAPGPHGASPGQMGLPGSLGPRMGLNMGPTGSINGHIGAPGPHGASPGHMGPPGSYQPRRGLDVGPCGSINGHMGVPGPDTDSVAMKELGSKLKKKRAQQQKQQRKNKKLAKRCSIDRIQLAKQCFIEREKFAKQCSIDREWLVKQSSSFSLSNRQPVHPVKRSAKGLLAKTTTPAGQEEKNQSEVVQEKEPEPKPEQKPVKSRPVARTSIPGTV